MFGRRKYDKRWVIVRDDHIAIMETLGSRTVKQVILFDSNFQVNTGIRQTGNNKRLVISNGSCTYRFQAPSRIAMLKWGHVILRAHEQGDWGKKYSFCSFAPSRANCVAKLLVDGENYFKELYYALLDAQEEVFITGWMVSANMHLLRPADEHPESTLAHVLRTKAEQGVKIYVALYKEMESALYNSSYDNKKILKDLHPNIQAVRHPDHWTFTGTFRWSHHEKIVVIDQQVAFIGGIDLCIGRFDSKDHSITDAVAPYRHLGKDYSNPLVKDFDTNRDVNDSELIDRQKCPRMPWHDVHCMVIGQAAADAGRHFIHLWNHIKQEKYMARENLPYLHKNKSQGVQKVGSHRSFKRRSTSERSVRRSRTSTSAIPDEAPLIPSSHCDFNRQVSDIQRSTSVLSISPSSAPFAEANVQLLRSACLWSNGLPQEDSVYQAYIDAITNAEHHIYIENQFFVSSCGTDDVHRSAVVENKIAGALVKRIIRAHLEKKPFKVYVMIPVMPCFEGAEIWQTDAWILRCTIRLQQESIFYGPNSIYENLKDTLDWTEYIQFFSLRAHGFTPDGQFHEGQCYIHSKVMLVDDKIAIIGSANINDRSMLGSRDSEVCVRIESQPGRSGFVTKARREIWAEHLCMSEDDIRFLDPASSECWSLWINMATVNDAKYKTLSNKRCWPMSDVHSYAQFKKNLNRPLPNVKPEEVKELAPTRVISYPVHFLKDEDLYSNVPSSSILASRTIFT